MSSLAFISMPGGGEWLVIGFIGLLLFGKRLPEVARSLGQSVTEFKKGLSSFEADCHRPVLETAPVASTPPDDPQVAAGRPAEPPQLSEHPEPVQSLSEPSLALESSAEQPS